uniref:Uncharacterized protein n=1 Tax=viral metagenome TaxID=1070528 RepID=A0A6C0CN78_9ZZZZ
MQTQMKNTIYILTLGVITQIIFWSFVSSLVGAETIRGLKSEIRNLKNEGIPCKEGTNKTNCICPNTECLKFIEKTGDCHPIDCMKWDKYNSKCKPAGKDFTAPLILQSIPLTGIFGSGFGNMGRWDIFGIYMGTVFGGCFLACVATCLQLCSQTEADFENKSAGKCMHSCISCLLSVAVLILWIYGIIVIANKEIKAPYKDWEGNDIMCKLVG